MDPTTAFWVVLSIILVCGGYAAWALWMLTRSRPAPAQPPILPLPVVESPVERTHRTVEKVLDEVERNKKSNERRWEVIAYCADRLDKMLDNREGVRDSDVLDLDRRLVNLLLIAKNARGWGTDQVRVIQDLRVELAREFPVEREEVQC